MSEQTLLIDEQAADVSRVTPDRPQVPTVAEALNPLMLLQQAVDKGMDPGQLKALVDLQEQWRAARAKEAFASAMNAVQIEMPCVVRDADNKQTSSKYVRFETVLHRARPIYTGHGFSISFSEDDSEKAATEHRVFKRIVCIVRHIEGHSERHWIDLPIDGIGPKGNPIGGMNAVQGAISTGTYGQRVLLCRVFNIPIADTDLDGQAPNPPANPNAPKAPPRGGHAGPTAEQLRELVLAWQGQNPDPSGDKVQWSINYKLWVCRTTERTFDPSKAHNWTVADYEKCKAELESV